MRTTDQSPARARAMTSGPTGWVHSLLFSTSRSQAARLYATGSKLSVTTAQHRRLAKRPPPRARRHSAQLGEALLQIIGIHRRGQLHVGVQLLEERLRERRYAGRVRQVKH